jgi:hypothetical protein
MPPRRKRPRRKLSRRTAPPSWRPGSEPARSVLTRGRRSTSRRAERFSPLQPWRPEPELSPLQKIPTLAAWLAAQAEMMREEMMRDMGAARRAI